MHLSLQKAAGGAYSPLPTIVSRADCNINLTRTPNEASVRRLALARHLFMASTSRMLSAAPRISGAGAPRLQRAVPNIQNMNAGRQLGETAGYGESPSLAPDPMHAPEHCCAGAGAVGRHAVTCGSTVALKQETDRSFRYETDVQYSRTCVISRSQHFIVGLGFIPVQDRYCQACSR